MPKPEFLRCDAAASADLVELNIEYVTWVLEQAAVFFDVPVDEVVGQPPAVYAREALSKVVGEGPPRGSFYLIRLDGAVAGMGGLRRLSATEAEIKRVYVRPAFRGLNLGRRVVQRLVDDARAFGYERICLDSAPFMQPAHRVYEALGFRDCPPYEGVEVPAKFRGQWRFMQRALGPDRFPTANEESHMQITVETLVRAPLADVWHAWTTPAHIVQWNAASDDWHTTAARVDLRVGGGFSSRMEARDGSMGFDFEGICTQVVEPRLIECRFGERTLRVTFDVEPEGVRVRETFDAEPTHPPEQQRQGWQSILDRFARHVEAGSSR